MKYKKIKNIQQYNEYCKKHEELFLEEKESDLDVIELLEVLIEDYDKRNSKTKQHRLNPVELLRSLLKNSNTSQVSFASELDISKQLISDVLNYRRNISKGLVIKLAEYFSMTQEAFSRPYDLKQSTADNLIIIKEVPVEVIREVQVIKEVETITEIPVEMYNPKKERVLAKMGGKMRRGTNKSYNTKSGTVRVSRNRMKAGDDLELIEGIGPKTMKALIKSGITTFYQLSKISERELELALNKGKIRKRGNLSNWRKQAKSLSRRL